MILDVKAHTRAEGFTSRLQERAGTTFLLREGRVLPVCGIFIHINSQNCIGPTIRIGQESWCLPYAGFLLTLPLYTLPVKSNITQIDASWLSMQLNFPCFRHVPSGRGSLPPAKPLLHRSICKLFHLSFPM